MKILKSILNAALWMLAAFMAFSGCVFFPSLASLFMFIFAAVAAPIGEIQVVLSKVKIAGMKKVALLLVLFFISIFFVPEETSNSTLAFFLFLIMCVGVIAYCTKNRKRISAPAEDVIGENDCIPEKSHGNKKSQSVSKYVVFDIETTGFSRKDDRIIEIAANEYSKGNIVNQFHTYINPGFHIPASITQLTGISDVDVSGAPSICDIKAELLDFFGDKLLVGHNITSFDIPFLQEQLGVQIANDRVDTLALARYTFPGLPSYKLSYLDQALHLGGLDHHRASNDIVINNALYQACCNPEKYAHYLKDKAALDKIPIERRGYLHSQVDIHSITPSCSGAIKHTHLTGKTICFTGEISIPRERACQMAVDAGAILKSHVSKKLDYLVVGEQDKRLVGETGMSNAQHYAASLVKEGHKRLKVIDEAGFYKLLKETAE